MSANRRVLTVFLASPSDLTDERRKARQVVKDLNDSLRESGLSLEVLGWEDTLPTAQRPQEAINRDLDQADLFIGILWRRWGQPTGNPEFSSGFEEEFRRASARKDESRVPEMWLFFKEVESGQLQDPGEELQKVLRFRSRCESEKRLLYKQFTGIDDWERILRGDLLTFALRHITSATSEPGGEGAKHSDLTSADGAPSLKASAPEPSLAPLADILNDLAEGGDPKSHSSEEGGLYSLRLYLVGASLLAKSNTSSSLLGAHEINSLFRMRSQVNLLPIEVDLVERTVLADRAGLKPGWYWFPQDEKTQVHAVITRALFDSDTEVRIQALTILRKGRVRQEEWRDLVFSVKVADQQPPEVQDAFWAYLETIVEAADQEQLASMMTSETWRAHAEVLLLIIRAESDPDAALASAATAIDTPNDRLVSRLLPNLGEVSPLVLTAAFLTHHLKLRNAVAAELDRRGLMNEIRSAAQTDDSSFIRTLEYRDRLRVAAASGSEPPPLPDKLSFEAHNKFEVERLRHLPYEQLLHKVDWINLEGSAAYMALATEHWHLMADQVRGDIVDRFERIRQKTVDRFVQSALKETDYAKLPAAAQEALETQTKAEVEKQWDEYTGFIRGRFAVAALAGIALHGTHADAPFVRRYLKKSSSYAEVAVKAAARVGDQSDVAPLLRLALDSYGDTKVKAAEAALLLSRDSREVLVQLVRSNQPVLVRLGLSRLKMCEEAEASREATELLRNQDGAVRLEAAQFLISALNSAELLRMLDAYVSEGYYYYNVIVAVDKSLYCRIPALEPEREPELDDFGDFAEPF